MYPKAQVSAERIEELLSSESLIKDPEKGVTETNNEGTLEFNDVTFVYHDGEEAVIKNVSFKAKKGETIAFITTELDVLVPFITKYVLSALYTFAA